METFHEVNNLDTDIKIEKPDTSQPNHEDDAEIIDNVQENSHRTMSEDPLPHTTNFSISEILKPSFGQKRESKQTCMRKKDEKCSIKRDHKLNEFKDLLNSGRDNHSLLFDFRCLNSKLITDEEHGAISENEDFKEKLEPQYKRVKISSGQTFNTFSIHSITRIDNLKYFEEREKCGKQEAEENKSAGTSLRTLTSPVSSPLKDSAPRKPVLWPAWVYCTRYSDRPSAGPRSRKVTRRSKRPDEKRPRTAFTSEQLGRLRSEFEVSKYLTEQRRKDLARSLDLSEAQIKIWYQNKRAKIKKANGSSASSLALHLMAQGLYNHKAYSGENVILSQ